MVSGVGPQAQPFILCLMLQVMQLIIVTKLGVTADISSAIVTRLGVAGDVLSAIVIKLGVTRC